MRKILYAEGVFAGKGEEEIKKNEERDERILSRVISDFSWAQGAYAERNEEFERQEKWFYRDHYDRPIAQTSDIDYSPRDASSNISDEHLVTLNIPFSSIQRAHTMLTGDAPIIEVLKNRGKSEEVSKLLHGVIQINSRRWGANPMHDAIFDQLLYGWGVVRTTWNRNSWEDEQKFDGDRPLYEFPVSVKAIPPKEVYPIPGGVHERWKAVVHASQMHVYEVEEEWGVVLHMTDEDNYEEDELFDYTEPLNPDKKVNVLDYWCWEGRQIVHCVIAHNQYVMRPAIMKYYDALPYTIFFCGSTTSKNPKNYGLSINYGLLDSVAEAEYLTTRMMRIADLYADPTLVVVRVNDSPIKTDPTDKMIDLIEGESAHYLTHNGSLPEMDKLLGFFRGQIEEEGFATVSGQSGIDTIAQQQSAMIKIFKPAENAQLAWEDINHKIIGLIQRYSWDEKIEVRGRLEGDESQEAFNFSLKGSDTKGCRETKVILRARFPLEELRNITVAATAKNSELIPTPIIQKRFLGARDVKAWERTILEQRVKNSPESMGMMIQQRMQLINEQSTVQALINEELEKMKGENEVAQRQEPGRGGAAENPAPMQEAALPADQLLRQTMADAQTGVVDNPAPTSLPVEGANGYQ